MKLSGGIGIWRLCRVLIRILGVLGGPIRPMPNSKQLTHAAPKNSKKGAVSSLLNPVLSCKTSSSLAPQVSKREALIERSKKLSRSELGPVGKKRRRELERGRRRKESCRLHNAKSVSQRGFFS